MKWVLWGAFGLGRNFPFGNYIDSIILRQGLIDKLSNNPKLRNIGTVDVVIIDTIKDNSVANTIPLKIIEPPRITTMPEKY